MADGVLGAHWAALEQQIDGEVAAWRRARPRATLGEIELAAAAVAARLQAVIVEALVGEAAELGETPGRPSCPACGGRLRRRGRRGREILLPRPPTIVDGRPTADHPFRRPFQQAG